MRLITPVITEVSGWPTRPDASVSAGVGRDSLATWSLFHIGTIESGESKQLTSEAHKPTAEQHIEALTLNTPDCGLTEVLSLAGVASSDYPLAVNSVSRSVGLYDERN